MNRKVRVRKMVGFVAEILDHPEAKSVAKKEGEPLPVWAFRCLVVAISRYHATDFRMDVADYHHYGQGLRSGIRSLRSAYTGRPASEYSTYVLEEDSDPVMAARNFEAGRVDALDVFEGILGLLVLRQPADPVEG